MNHDNRTGTSRPALAVKGLLAGVALSAMLGFSINAQAQCTIANWTDATGLTSAAAGNQGTNNRRYGGPCGLRVPLDGTSRFLTDETPAAESTYIARFYAFFQNVTQPTVIFEADDGSNPRVQVWYNFPTSNDVTLRVITGSNTDVTIANVGTGWKSIELVWEASNAANNVLLAVGDRNGVTEATGTVNTTGISIANASLGNIEGATGGSIDFDDFDSRRISRPGRLCRGDINGDGNVNLTDLLFLQQEVSTNGVVIVNGQPDYNEDGQVNLTDLLLLQATHVAVNNPACPI